MLCPCCVHVYSKVCVFTVDESEDAAQGCIPGGLFAGVGQFPSVQRDSARLSTDLPELKYKTQSVLRLGAVWM